jgi:hypothetical protein
MFYFSVVQKQILLKPATHGDLTNNIKSYLILLFTLQFHRNMSNKQHHYRHMIYNIWRKNMYLFINICYDNNKM